MRGFTLLELIVVLFLIGLSAGILIPKMGAFFGPSPADFPEELKTLLQKGAKNSKTSKEPVLLIFDAETRQVLLQTPQGKIFEKLKVPEEIEIKAERLLSLPQGEGVIFFPEGFSSGGEIEILNHKTGQNILFRIPSLLSWVEEKASP